MQRDDKDAMVVSRIPSLIARSTFLLVKALRCPSWGSVPPRARSVGAYLLPTGRAQRCQAALSFLLRRRRHGLRFMEGGFETRPYKPLDFARCLAKGDMPGLPQQVKADVCRTPKASAPRATPA